MENIADDFDLASAFWEASSSLRNNWWEAYKRTSTEYEALENLTSLHIAAFSGFLPLIHGLLETGHAGKVNERDSLEHQPVSILNAWLR